MAVTSWGERRRLLRLGVLLASLALLAFVVEAAVLLVRLPYSGLSFSWGLGGVDEVAAGSPAMMAGLRPGDVIVAINGRPRLQAAADYPSQSGADSVTLEIERDGRPLPTIVLRPIAPLGLVLVKRLIPVVVALGFALYSFYVWAHKPYDLTVILYLAFSQLGAAVLTFGALSAVNVSWAAWGFVLTLSLLSPVLVHFHLRFAWPRPGGRWPAGLLALYLVALLLIGWRLIYLWLPIRLAGFALLYNLILGYFALASFLSLAILAYAYAISSPSKRNHIRLVVSGTFLAFLPLVALAILPSILSNQNVVAYELTFPFLLSIPLAYGLAVRRHDVLQIERVVNRGVIRLTLFFVLGVLAFILMTSLARLWPGAWTQGPLPWAVVALLLAAVFTPLLDRLQAAADWLIYGGWYNYRSVISEMSQALGGTLDADELARLLVHRLAGLLHVKGAALFLAGDEGGLALVQAKGLAPLPAGSLPAGNLSAHLLRVAQPQPAADLCAARLAGDLSLEEQGWLAHPPVQLWVPLVRHEKLPGLLLLGAKSDGEPFDAEDERLLNTLALEAAITAENVQLVRALSQRAAEIKLLYSQLLDSREEERKRLARELHDQVIQDLINLHYYLDPNAPRALSLHKENLQPLRAHVQSVIDTLRAVCTELRPAALDDLSLSLAMQGYLEEVAGQDGLAISLRVVGDAGGATEELPEEVRVCLYRVLQEAISNVRRHAQARQVQVELRIDPDQVGLSVQDDGRGFHCPANLGVLTREGHFGLAGIQERLRLVGGAFQVESAAGRGTTLRAHVPLV
ncbi:MAG: ATP-binding protein [Chloroflexota bacterium]